MDGGSTSVGYIAFLRRDQVQRLVAALTVTTLAYGMVQLALFFLVRSATHSSADASYALGALNLGAGLSSPVRGRLVDRRGRGFLPVMATVFAILLVGTDIAAHAGASAWFLAVACGLVGLTFPPVFSSARAVWPLIVETELVRRGYALMSIILDVGQVSGPALAAGLAQLSGWAGPIVCAAATLGGTALSVPSGDAEEREHTPVPMPRNPLANRPLLGMLAIGVVLGVGEGVVQVGVPVVLSRWHHAALSGPLLAAFAAGSIAGGLWFGTRRWQRSALERFLWGVFALGTLIGPLAIAHSPLALAPLLVAAGTAFGPTTVSLFEALDEVLPGSGTEALSWITTFEGAGMAAGSAGAGALATHVSTSAPFIGASLLLVVTAALALVVRRSHTAAAVRSS